MRLFLLVFLFVCLFVCFVCCCCFMLFFIYYFYFYWFFNHYFTSNISKTRVSMPLQSDCSEVGLLATSSWSTPATRAYLALALQQENYKQAKLKTWSIKCCKAWSKNRVIFVRLFSCQVNFCSLGLAKQCKLQI